MSYTLDDAHEALALADWYLDQTTLAHMSSATVDASIIVLQALKAIEAQLPDPCPRCGSDSCSGEPVYIKIAHHPIVPKYIYNCEYDA